MISKSGLRQVVTKRPLYATLDVNRCDAARRRVMRLEIIVRPSADSARTHRGRNPSARETAFSRGTITSSFCPDEPPASSAARETVTGWAGAARWSAAGEADAVAGERSAVAGFRDSRVCRGEWMADAYARVTRICAEAVPIKLRAV